MTTMKKSLVLWIHPGTLKETLSAATYLDTTHELRHMGWNVILAASSDYNGVEYIRGIEVLGIKHPDRYFMRQFFFHIRIIHLILQQWNTVDIVLFRNISAIWLLPLMVLPRSKRPIFVMDTRSVHMPDFETLRIKLRGWYINFNNWLGNRFADGRTAITERMAEVVNVPSHKLWGIWPSGVDKEIFEPSWKTRPKEIVQDCVDVIYIGALEYERGLMPFSKAIMKANELGMAFRFSLIGDGRQWQELKDFAEQSEGKIRVQKSVPHEEIPLVLSQAQVGVLPFPNEEKFRVSSPIKLFEYMASGLSILATKIPCHTDVIGDSDYVIWAKDAEEANLLNALREVWTKRHELVDKGREAVENVQNWTWAATAQKLSAALERGLEARNESQVPL